MLNKQINEKNLKGKFCDKPWSHFEILDNKKTFLCCPSWVSQDIGNLQDKEINELWNSPTAQKIRASILDGSFKYCNKELCPLIQNGTLPTLEEGKKMHGGIYEKIITNKEVITSTPPNIINFSFDKSCNLKCPSCRTDFIQESGDRYQKNEEVQNKIMSYVKDQDKKHNIRLNITGSGDPFGSKLYRTLLYSLDGKAHPNIRISLQTNGVLFTKSAWDQMEKIRDNIDQIIISIDSSSKEVYNKVRVGGNWDLLMKNLKFLSQLKKDGKLPAPTRLDFVVQTNNYKDMPGFILLCKELGFDAYFSKIIPWYKNKHFDEQMVWKEDHPEFKKFIDVLKNPIFEWSQINFGNISEYRNLAKEEFEKEENEKYKEFVCTRAFQEIQVMDNGKAYPCCPAWVNYYDIGNVKTQDYQEVWNGKKMVEFRKSVTDGTFKYCNKKSCPHLEKKTEFVRLKKTIEKDKMVRDLVKEDIKLGLTILKHGPLTIQCAYDRTCNLSCPSCRRKVIVIDGEKRNEILQLQDKLIKEYFSDIELIVLTPSGDPFASFVFKKLLNTLSKENAPKLKDIVLLTNGLLLKKNWDNLSNYVKQKTHTINVSIDAAKESTYLINRRGGDWKLLLENLEFLKSIKSPIGNKNIEKQVNWLGTSFVVQKNNYSEMKDFLLLCAKYNIDKVTYHIIEPDFIRDLKYSDYFEEWANKAVHEKNHPEHEKLLEVLKDPIWDSKDKNLPKIDLGALAILRSGQDISQFNDNLEEKKALENRGMNENVSSKKDVWYDGRLYYVERNRVKKLFNTDVVKIETNKVLKYDHKIKEWVECSSDEILTYNSD